MSSTNQTSRKLSAKHNQLLNTARNLIARHGVRRVTVEEICRKAGVSKMTFYKYYPNKHAIVGKILDDLVELGKQKFTEITSRNIPFEAKVRLLIQLKMEESARFSEDFLEELLRTDARLSDNFWRKAVDNEKITLDFFRKAREKGELRRDLNLDFLQYMLEHLQNLVKDPNLQQIIPSNLDLIRELINFWFYGILPPTGEPSR